MPSESELINTSTIAKLYRTTTSDIEKKLTTMGFKPYRTVVQQSGRRFMVWEKQKVLAALDAYKQRRLEALQAREQQRKELTEKQKTIPRTGHHAYPVDSLTAAPSDFAPLDSLEHQEPRQETAVVPKKVAEEMLETMREMQAYIEVLRRELEGRKANKESAPN